MITTTTILSQQIKEERNHQWDQGPRPWMIINHRHSNKEWNVNGHLRYEDVIDGKGNRIWKEYNVEGKLIKKETYKEGELIKTEEF